MTGMEAIRGTQEDCKLLVATRVVSVGSLVAESSTCISTNWNLVRSIKICLEL